MIASRGTLTVKLDRSKSQFLIKYVAALTAGGADGAKTTALAMYQSSVLR